MTLPGASWAWWGVFGPFSLFCHRQIARVGLEEGHEGHEAHRHGCWCISSPRGLGAGSASTPSGLAIIRSCSY